MGVVIQEPVKSDSMYVRRLQQHPLMIRLLALHGIPYEPVEWKPARESIGIGWRKKLTSEQTTLHVTHMQAHFLHRADASRAGDSSDALIQSDAASLRKMRLAVRAVYAAGLDHAEVAIRCHDPHSAIIERIKPIPAPAQGASREQDHLGAYTDSDIQLGMDPEFLLVSERGKLVPANRYLNFHGPVGYDSATIRGRPDLHPLAELRPDPSSDPAGLVRNLRKTMWMATSIIDDPTISWRAGGMPIPGLPLGGHIHFSGAELSGPLVRALDNYLAMPIMLLEQPSSIARRRKYGRLGDIRIKSYGGFEYRTLPSLLISPTLTKGVLALAKLIVINNASLTYRPLDQETYVQAYYNGNKSILQKPVERVWREIAALPQYMQYERYLQPIKQWIDNGRTWNEEVDFRKYWRIPPYG
jgi:hypothetical protein